MSALPRHAVLALALLLGACSVLPRPETPTVYRLPGGPARAATAAAPVAWSLQVDTPQAGSSLDGARIVVLPSAEELNVYRGARWSERMPVLLRDRLFDAFQADGRIRALSIDENNLQADYALTGNLRAFQAEYEHGRPVAVIRYDAQLIRPGAQRILAMRRFESRVPAQGKEVPQVVAAFGAAADALAAQVLPWTFSAVQTAGSGERSD